VSNKLEFLIEAKNLMAGGLNSAMSSMRSFGSSARSMFSGFGGSIAGQFVGAMAAMRLFGAAAQAVSNSIAQAFKFETLNAQFAVLFRSFTDARRHMKDLAEYAARTPFKLDEIANASKSLHVFSGGVMGSAGSVAILGDVAAATGTKLEELAFWTGRAYSMIRGGQPFGEAAMRLQEMGVLTPQARQAMEELAKTGGSAAQVFSVLLNRMGEFAGGAQVLSGTGAGLASTLSDIKDMNAAAFASGFVEQMKTAMIGLNSTLEESRGIMEGLGTAAGRTVEAVAFMGNQAIVAPWAALGQALGGDPSGALRRLEEANYSPSSENRQQTAEDYQAMNDRRMDALTQGGADKLDMLKRQYLEAFVEIGEAERAGNLYRSAAFEQIAIRLEADIAAITKADAQLKQASAQIMASMTASAMPTAQLELATAKNFKGDAEDRRRRQTAAGEATIQIKDRDAKLERGIAALTMESERLRKPTPGMSGAEQDARTIEAQKVEREIDVLKGMRADIVVALNSLSAAAADLASQDRKAADKEREISRERSFDRRMAAADDPAEKLGIIDERIREERARPEGATEAERIVQQRVIDDLQAERDAIYAAATTGTTASDPRTAVAKDDTDLGPQQSSLREFFMAGYGETVKPDAAEQTAKNTAETNRLLERLLPGAGGIEP